MTPELKYGRNRIVYVAVQYLVGLHYGREHDDFGISEYISLTCIN